MICGGFGFSAALRHCVRQRKPLTVQFGLFAAQLETDSTTVGRLASIASQRFLVERYFSTSACPIDGTGGIMFSGSPSVRAWQCVRAWVETFSDGLAGDF